MIKSLYIKNYLLIEEVQIDFEGGLTVITGETGAGKSLIIDSIELAIGARADSGIVRRGCDKAEIFVTFDADREGVQEWLHEHDMYEGSEAILQRIIFRDRPSRAYLNSRPLTLNSIRDIASRIVAIHGQSEHQTLQKPATQRDILDGFGDGLDTARKVSELASAIRRAETEKAGLEDRFRTLNDKLDLLQHQFDTLKQLEPAAGEFSELKAEHIKVTHASELAATLGEISYQLFYSDDMTVSNTLAESVRRIDQLLDVDDSLAQFKELLCEAQMRVDDVARELNVISERTEFDPARIGMLEERMAALQQQARIHGVDADLLPDTAAALGAQIDEIETALGEVASSDEKLSQLKAEHRSTSATLTEKRKKAARRLGAAVTENMQYLGMADGEFSVDLIAEEPDTFAGFGHETVRFVVSTAPGQEPGPLASVASGGELSRLSLAIQVVAANVTQVPSVVFDEIDVGIGGKVAERVGRLLRTLGKSLQIFCVTHLPQVAAKGDQQLNVTKSTRSASNIQIQRLDEQQRVKEIARMLSGAKITARTTEHARELLTQSGI